MLPGQMPILQSRMISTPAMKMNMAIQSLTMTLADSTSTKNLIETIESFTSAAFLFTRSVGTSFYMPPDMVVR